MPVPMPLPPPIPERPTGAGYACHPDLAAGIPTTVDVYLEHPCPCDERLRCEFLEGPQPRTLELVMTVERDDPGLECEACDPNPRFNPRLPAQCDLPALEAGEWQVHVGGNRAFDLPVGEGRPFESGARCVRFAEPAPRAEDEWPGLPSLTASICGPELAGVGAPTPLRIEHPCLNCCDARAACDVQVISDGFGNSIHVRPLFTRDFRACVADCGVCEGTSVTDCLIPALPAGVYPVFVDDGIMTRPGSEPTLVVGEIAPGPVRELRVCALPDR